LTFKDATSSERNSTPTHTHTRTTCEAITTKAKARIVASLNQVLRLIRNDNYTQVVDVFSVVAAVACSNYAMNLF